MLNFQQNQKFFGFFEKNSDFQLKKVTSLK